MAQQTKKATKVITPGKVSKDDLIKEREDIEGLIAHLEEEYRKASVSEKNYQELKEKYEKRLKEIKREVGQPEKKEETRKKEEKKPKETEKPTKPATEEKIKEKKEAKLPKEVKPSKEVKAPKEAEVPTEAKIPKESPKDIAKETSEEVPKEGPKRVSKEEKAEKGPGLGMFGKLFKRVPKKAGEETSEKAGEEKAKKDEPLQEIPKEPPKGVEEGGGKSEEEMLIEQAALAVGSEQEGAASMIEGAKEKMAAAVESQKAEAAEMGGEEAAETVGEDAGASSIVDSKFGVELEKLKVMIDTIRETKRATDETIQTLAENIGEIRSLTFQTDGAIREVTTKIEKIEDEIGEIKPTEIGKRFREINTSLEKQEMNLEKLSRKSDDLAAKINKVHEMLRGAGGIENLVDVNNTIQKKIADIKSIIKYIERLAFKTEKVFIDLNKGMEEFTIYKTKQEGLDETAKDLIKSVDKLSLDLENNYTTKSDLNTLREDILGIQKELGEISKGLPVLQAKLPSPLLDLMKEREDIILFLESLEENLEAKSISKEEYEEVKRKNLEKLDILGKELRREWARLEDYSKKGAVPAEAETPAEEVEKPAEGEAAQPAEGEEASEDEEVKEGEGELPKEEEAPKEGEALVEVEGEEEAVASEAEEPPVETEEEPELEMPEGEEGAEEKPEEETEERVEEKVGEGIEETVEETVEDENAEKEEEAPAEEKSEEEREKGDEEEPVEKEEVGEEDKEAPKSEEPHEEEKVEKEKTERKKKLKKKAKAPKEEIVEEDEGKSVGKETKEMSTLLKKIRTKMKDI